MLASSSVTSKPSVISEHVVLYRQFDTMSHSLGSLGLASLLQPPQSPSTSPSEFFSLPPSHAYYDLSSLLNPASPVDAYPEPQADPQDIEISILCRSARCYDLTGLLSPPLHPVSPFSYLDNFDSNMSCPVGTTLSRSNAHNNLASILGTVDDQKDTMSEAAGLGLVFPRSDSCHDLSSILLSQSAQYKSASSSRYRTSRSVVSSRHARLCAGLGISLSCGLDSIPEEDPVIETVPVLPNGDGSIDILSPSMLPIQLGLSW